MTAEVWNLRSEDVASGLGVKSSRGEASGSTL